MTNVNSTNIVQSTGSVGNTQNAIEIRELSKSFWAYRLDGISFNVPSGYITGFVGPNGSGKTTTIKLILSIMNSDSGSIKLFGEPAAPALNGQIGVVMDQLHYPEDWTPKNIETAIAPFYEAWNTESYNSYLTQFGLPPTQKIKELSHGMKTKLQLAVALSHNARLLILDEPTSGLDPAARDDICELLRDFCADGTRTVFFSTHITSDVEKIADFLVFIIGGRIVYSGTKDDLLESYVRIIGGKDELSQEQQTNVIGYREYSTGFDGMVAKEHLSSLPKGIQVESLNLDEIVVYITKEGTVA